MNSENDVFLKKMIGVKPIKKNDNVKSKFAKVSKKNILKATKKTSITEEGKKNKKEKNSKYFIEEGKINKDLKRGKIKADIKIDFHGITVNESENIFSNSIKEAYKNSKRCILFITGKGLNIKKTDDDNAPRLFYGKTRQSFQEWVTRPEFSKYILAVERADKEHGGDGAFFVYLRKKKISF